MKILIALPMAGALLMGVPVSTMADDVAQSSDAAKASMQNNANASAQSTTDMSYGGTANVRTSSGAGPARGSRCASGPTCDVYFGN